MSKSAASFKPVKNKNKSVADDRTPEEYFNEAKSGLIAICESYKRNAYRPDKVVSEYANLKDLGFDNLDLAMKMIGSRITVYDIVLERLNAITFEAITSDEWNDPFEDMIEYVTDACISLEVLMCKYACFDAVRPFGEKVESLRMTLFDMGKK